MQRTAALFFEGTENTTVEGCFFERFDGLGVFFSGYTRGASVSHSEFAWGGETCIALWGYGRGSPVPGVGPDMTGGDQPRGTYIGYNVFREIGVWQKQSSAVFQAEAGLSLIEHNLMYNMPRAAVCFNDGALGGSVLQFNVMANTCRESGDHGPFSESDSLQRASARARAKSNPSGSRPQTRGIARPTRTICAATTAARSSTTFSLRISSSQIMARWQRLTTTTRPDTTRPPSTSSPTA